MARPDDRRNRTSDVPEHDAIPAPGNPRTSSQTSGGSLDGLLASREIVVACGPGGVGKTTTAAAAAAMAAWRHGGKVLVLTIDPARRLADALGLEGIGNRETRVPDEAFTRAGVRPRGELWAAMLDTKESWDALIRIHAPDERTRDEILSNPLYSQISSRFVQSHDYIAMERLYEIHSGGDYDLIVVDTPPTRNALDFLDAPERMAEFFSSRLLRWLIVPYRSRLVNLASRPFYQIADRILGTQFLGDISQFFILFQTMYAGFIERAQAVGRLLADRRTTFIVVATLEASPLREAQVFVKELGRRDLHVGAIVLNKVLPEYLRDPAGRHVAERLKDGAEAIAEKLASDASLEAVDVATLSRVLAELGSSYLDYNVVAQREAEQRAEMANVPDVLVSVPFFDTDVYDMEGLLRLGERLWELIVLDYHLHLWPHGQRDTVPTVEHVAEYCELARHAGVTEIALTEHLFRFVQADHLLRGFWDDEPDAALRASMVSYWDDHAKADLDAYVDCVLEAKAQGLPVVLGLEVDYYRGRMHDVERLLAGYPFDVLLGSVHWIGVWRFDDLNDEVSMNEWSARDVDKAWDDYALSIEELAASGTCDVLAHPDLIKVAGFRSGAPEECFDRLAEAAAKSGMAAECSSAGLRKPVGEIYPAPPLLERFAAAGVPFTTASDAHRAEHVADRSSELLELLSASGIASLQAYSQRRPVSVPIAPPEKDEHHPAAAQPPTRQPAT